MLTGLNPTDIEQEWSIEDVNWVLGVAQARELARLQIAKNHKAMLSEVWIQWSPTVRVDKDSDGKRRLGRRKKKDASDNN